MTGLFIITYLYTCSVSSALFLPFSCVVLHKTLSSFIHIKCLRDTLNVNGIPDVFCWRCCCIFSHLFIFLLITVAMGLWKSYLCEALYFSRKQKTKSSYYFFDILGVFCEFLKTFKYLYVMLYDEILETETHAFC